MRGRKGNLLRGRKGKYLRGRKGKYLMGRKGKLLRGRKGKLPEVSVVRAVGNERGLETLFWPNHGPQCTHDSRILCHP